MFLEIFRVAWRSIRANKMRSFLTMLGIIIGVIAVVMSSAIGLSAKAGVTKQVESLGSNILTVMPGAVTVGGVSRGFGAVSTLTVADANAIAQQDPDVEYVSPLVTANEQVIYGNNNLNTSIEGTSADYPAIRNVTLAMGRYFLPSEVQDAANVAVLGSQAYQTLFSGVTASPIGQTIDIGGIPFTVVGVAQSQGASGFANQDDAIAIPYTTAMNLFSGGNTVNEILVAAKSPNVMDSAQLEIESTLRAMHGLAPSQSDDFQIVNQATILNALSGVSRILTLLLDGISAISLLVGGIGIMNIMLVSVTERTREIGIRKAIGATRRVISAQFLTEATLLSVAGAVAGLVLSGVGTIIMSKMTGDGNLFSPVAAAASLGFSIAVGLVFGVYPARKAARLKPIDALRFE
ncbi:ABC transporter permease [Alicyclobacillus vulcanalis]|uniref:Putative ABC transport system permease protein n=1 Tax=Alicyclobacillus vulcanalis TaxID=252246 RepID=A0A1N7PFV9_9BACL|nr:ABC transporter permease [Alicyclobacillus vulcanalis]SIT09471.1 putative ABC transport system permease protein [Alicyclobacillus vulcanalis]